MTVVCLLNLFLRQCLPKNMEDDLPVHDEDSKKSCSLIIISDMVKTRLIKLK